MAYFNINKKYASQLSFIFTICSLHPLAAALLIREADYACSETELLDADLYPFKIYVL